MERRPKPGGIDRSIWLKALGEVQTAPLEDDPHVITTMEFARLLGVGRAKAEHRLKQMVTAGKAAHTEKRIRRVDGHVMCVTAYRLIQP
jgi:hypothetical protein